MSATRARHWKGSRPLAMGGVESEYSSGKRRKKSARARKRKSKALKPFSRGPKPGITKGF
jgi:hypothetical protein